MLRVSGAQRLELGLAKLRAEHFTLLAWLRVQSGIMTERNGRPVDSKKMVGRFVDLLRYAALRWPDIEVEADKWFPPIAWDTERFLGRRATRDEQARWSERLVSLEKRCLITTRGQTRGGKRRTNCLRLTAKGIEALRAIAAARGLGIITATIDFPMDPKPAIAIVRGTGPLASRFRIDWDRQIEPTRAMLRRMKRGPITSEPVRWVKSNHLPPKRRGPVSRDEITFVEMLARTPLQYVEEEAKELEQKLGLSVTRW